MHDVAVRPSRYDYVRYDETAQAKSAAFKKKFQEIEELIDGLVGSMGDSRRHIHGRAIENALKACEEAYMWLGKAIRDEQVHQRGAALQEERCRS